MGTVGSYHPYFLTSSILALGQSLMQQIGAESSGGKTTPKNPHQSVGVNWSKKQTKEKSNENM
jgi:hypothetical protein